MARKWIFTKEELEKIDWVQKTVRNMSYNHEEIICARCNRQFKINLGDFFGQIYCCIECGMVNCALCHTAHAPCTKIPGAT